jgi:hypothetical protein
VVTLLDMLVEKAGYFVSVGRMFEGLMFGIRGATSPNVVLRAVDFEELILQWTDLKSHCQKMEMEFTADSAAEAIAHFMKFKEQITYGMVMARGGELYRAFIAELSKQRFVLLSPARVKYFASIDPSEDPSSPFGQGVMDSFPDASYDIREATRCLATERDTGAVLHLMRILEIGLRRLAEKFQVPFERDSWNKIIDQIESKIREISSANSRPFNWKELEGRYARVAKEFRYLKDAWRNHAMHARSRYDFEEAQKIYDHTREFMCECAAVLPSPNE